MPLEKKGNCLGDALRFFIFIIQNGINNRNNLIGEKDNLVHIETIETTWGEEIDKDKGHKFGFLSKQ